MRSPTSCIRCGRKLAYPGALFCGASCCARWEAGDRKHWLSPDQLVQLIAWLGFTALVLLIIACLALAHT